MFIVLIISATFKKLVKRSFYRLLFLFLIIMIALPACSSYDGKFDVTYFFKTEPEKAVLDFFQSLANKDPDFIYTNLLPDKDRNSISREKYVDEFNNILSDVESIDVKRTVYLGYENNMSKVVAEFEVKYKNGEVKQYKKYIYLTEENNKWKIIFEKTFI
ncbi:MAG: hypothetical protein FJW63_02655 [Actinobacteria bacterium]|nr:hypothetical protein [Actinomycetota bacterium]